MQVTATVHPLAANTVSEVAREYRVDVERTETKTDTIFRMKGGHISLLQVAAHCKVLGARVVIE